MGRIMGIDWGERRIGVALSDESRTIASPHTVVPRSGSLDRDLEEIARLVRENAVDRVVFGMPVRLNGSRGPEAEGVLEVTARLGDRIQVPVTTWDERMSTVAAERALIGGDVSRKKRRGLVDQVAAALFLQAYLDSLREVGS
ncbi:MAG: Holliday junction resolvase RuvX [bacterium]|nr:MAG: Holliday junction resolvase RuvX [bacterium]